MAETSLNTVGPDLLSLMLEQKVEPGGWNVTQVANATLTGREPWKDTLDFVATITLTCNSLILMLGMGSAINWIEIWSHVRRPVGAAIGMLGQFAVLPLTGFVLSLLFKLRPYEALGVLMISCSPGGSLSNLLTYWADGDLALSIMMTACSSIMAFGGMPFNLWLYSQPWLDDGNEKIHVPFGSIMISLAFIMGPVIVGMIIRHYHVKAATIISKVASMVGWLGGAVAIFTSFLLHWEVVVMATTLIYAAAFILPITGFALAYTLAKFTCRSNKVARTIAIETGSQNIPVALSVIALSFPQPLVKGQILIFPTLYGIILLLESFLGITAYQVYKRRCSSPSDDTSTANVEEGTKGVKETSEHVLDTHA
nr:solute carrier family 10 member 6-like [Procambarus clarkii]XP_045607578.1 solute carrier family 10 member 6-like [Procambarus clarkii]XP_045607579.1 solute carrier family 10 member 6-like [Procambarus clarkii]XP_045607580.1 solute carrier family 10 member 6-like [Procambarus clarkii]